MTTLKKRIGILILLTVTIIGMVAFLVMQPVLAEDTGLNDAQSQNTNEQQNIEGGTPIIIAQGDCGAQGDNVTWTLDNQGTMTISGTGAMADYKETSVSDKLFVTTAPWGQYWSKITTIEFNMGSGVTSIGEYAFDGCEALTSVLLSGSIECIGGAAFVGCVNLTDIIISERTKEIGGAAFMGCNRLTDITLPNGIAKIMPMLFESCSELTGVFLPDSVSYISDGAFKYCGKLTDIYYGGNEEQWKTIQGSEKIDQQIHYDCSTFPKSVIIGKKAGTLTVRESLTLTAQLSKGSSKIDYIGWKSSNPTVATVNQKGVVTGWKAGTAIITAETFNSKKAECTVTVTGDSSDVVAQGQCGEDVYWRISPDRTLNIYGNGSMDCFWIEAPFNFAPWSNYISSFDKVVIDSGVTNVGGGAFSCCSDTTQVSLPDSIINIDYGAFFLCTGLKCVRLPKNIEKIGAWSFDGCSELSFINIPDHVLNIEKYAFAFCDNLTCIDIPEGVENISDNAFGFCTSLIHISIPDSITDLDDAFSYCTNLQYISIPETIKKISNYAFSDCDNLSNIYYGGSEEQWSKIEGYKPTKSNIHYNYDDLPDHVVITPSAIEIKVGKSEVLKTHYSLSDTAEDVEWISNDPNIVAVDENGNITGKNEGNAIVFSKTSDGHIANCDITVSSESVKSVQLNKEELTLIIGRTEQLIASIFPENADNKTIIWSSDNDNIATVDQNGKVTAKAEGTATITATAGDKTAECVITVTEQENIKLCAHSISLNESLDINFYFKEETAQEVEDEALALKCWRNGDDKNALFLPILGKSEDGQLKFSFTDIAAKEMGDVIYSQLMMDKDGDGQFETPVGFVSQYSVRQYAVNQLAKASDESLKSLLRSTLNFGAASQIFFGYDSKNSVNADLAPEDREVPKVALETLESYKASLLAPEGQCEEKLVFTANALVLKNQVQLKYYLNAKDDSVVTPESAKDYHLAYKVNDHEKEVALKYDSVNNEYFATIDVVAADLLKTYQAYVKDGEGKTISKIRKYSPMSYVRNKLNNDDEEQSLKDLCYAIYDYAAQANNYFKTH